MLAVGSVYVRATAAISQLTKPAVQMLGNDQFGVDENSRRRLVLSVTTGMSSGTKQFNGLVNFRFRIHLLV